MKKWLLLLARCIIQSASFWSPNETCFSTWTPCPVSTSIFAQYSLSSILRPCSVTRIWPILPTARRRPQRLLSHFYQNATGPAAPQSQYLFFFWVISAGNLHEHSCTFGEIDEEKTIFGGQLIVIERFIRLPESWQYLRRVLCDLKIRLHLILPSLHRNYIRLDHHWGVACNLNEMHHYN